MATNRPKQTKNKLLIFARTYISAGAVLLWTISTFSFPAEAAINEKINYQGKLTDSNSIIVPDGAYDMVFALYTAPSGGSAIWTESWTSAALWSESSSTTVTRNAAGCGGSGFTSIVYSTGTHESSLAVGQYVWNTTLKESAAITSVDTGANTICISNPYSSWASGDDLTNRIYLKSGLFSTMLGSVTSLSSVNFSQTLYLGLTVGSDGEMAPRKVLGAVPSALTAKTLNNNESATLGTAAGATLSIGNTTGGITMNSGGASTWTNTAGGLTISTATSGTLALTSAGALNFSAAAASTVTLANVTNALNFDNNTFTVDALNNRVGIGDSTPAALFTVGSGDLFRVDSVGRVSFAGSNIPIGMGTLQVNSTGTNNIALGDYALFSNTTGSFNTAIGQSALTYLDAGSNNTAVGFMALGSDDQNTSGSRNIAFGSNAGAYAIGDDNIFIGENAGNSYSVYGGTANRNVIIGAQAGNNLQMSQNNNIFIGFQAAQSETGSNKLYIENSNSTQPLIYGEFDNDLIRINGSFGIREGGSTPTYYTTFAGGDQSSNITYTLPTAYPTTSGYVLTSTTGGVLSWAASSGGMTNPMTTAGDIIYAGTGGTPTRLAGSASNGYVLAYNTSTNAPYWTAQTGGSSAWSALTNPTGNLALNTMGSYTTTMTWGSSTGSNNLFTLQDTANNTGTGYLFNAATASSSTLKPFHVSAAGAEAITVLANGNVGIGNASPSALFSVGSSSQFQVNGSGNVTGGTYNELALASQTDGFTIAGGTTSRTLTVTGANVSLNQSLRTSDSPTFLGLSVSGLTQGSILFAGTSGALSQDNSNFFWNSTSHYLRLDGGSTAPFSIGVDSSDSNKFKIAVGTGIAGSNQFSIDQNGVTTIASLHMGAQSFTVDAGQLSWIDMPVTSNASNGTVESYSAQLDGNVMLTLYGTSDGAGGTSNRSVRLGAPLGFVDATSTYYSFFQGGTQTADITYTLPVAAPAANGYVLTSTAGGVLSWTASAGGMTNPMTTAGDIIYAGTGGTPARLAGSGTSGWVLAYNTSTNAPYWTAMTGGGGALQSAYDYTSGNTILTTTGRNIAFTLGEMATPTSFTLENQDTAGTNAERIYNSIASGTLANALTIDNTGAGTMTNAINILETAGTVTTGINIGNNVGTGISIGTGVTTGISVGSGGITIAAGALAVNSDSITSDGATLTINAAGTVDVQDILNADSVTSDAGVSIAAGSSYTGAGAVTLSSGGSAGLTLNSASNTTTIDSSDTALTASGVTTLTLGAGVTITNASGNINLQPAGSGTTANVQIGAGGSGSNNPDLLGLDVKDNAGDPTGFEGAMYYNNNTNKFRCYQNTAWTDCIGSGGSVDLSSFTSADIAIDDTVPFSDVSNSNTNSKDTLESSQWEQRKRLPNRGFNFYTDFINETSTTATDNGLSETNSTGSTAQQAVNGTGRVGIARSTTSTSASGRAALSSGLSAVAFNGGSWFYETNVNVTTLSNSTERFQLLVGFRDTLTAANQVDGVYFLYDEGGVSTGSTAAAYWQTVTTSNSTRAFNTSLTQTTVTAGSWVRLGIEINATGTSATFYINGTAVATHTTNIPTGTSRATGFGTLLIKSVGTTARTVDFDYVNVVSDWTNAR